LPIVSTPASGGLTDLLKCSTNAWLAPDVSVAGLAQTLKKTIETLEAHDPCWDRHRSQRRARLQALIGSTGLRLERARIAAAADGPRSAHYAEFSGEFEFERAYEAYEALIDALCAECRA
jgi:hypothetical protein